MASSLVVFAKQQKQNKGDEAIKAVVRSMWFVTSDQDFRRVISTPYLAISVRDKSNGGPVFRNKADMEKFLKEARARLAKQPMDIGGPVSIVEPKPQLSNSHYQAQC